MRRLMIIASVVAAASAAAEWVKYAENDAAVSYRDLARVRIDGDRRRVWELQDLKREDRNRAMSWHALGV